MLRVSVVREILNSRISAFALPTSKPSAMLPPIVVAFKNPRRVSSIRSSYAEMKRLYSSSGRARCQQLLSAANPFRVRVDVEASLPQEADQGDPGRLSQLDGETRRGGDGRHDRDTRGVRFLNNFEARSPGNHENAIRERKSVAEQKRSNDLVRRVVSADVLSNLEQIPVAGKESRRVEASRPRKDRLSLAQSLRQAVEKLRRDLQPRA